MIINYYGVQFFKIQFGDLVIAINPIAKNAHGKSTRFGADIVLISLNHADFNGAKNLSHGGRTPFVIDGPGEYEVKNVSIKGFPTRVKYGETQEKINTTYCIKLEGINVCFLGALETAALPADLRESVPDVDILFVPIGGRGVLSPTDANKISVSLTPKIIIPMHYDASALKKFLQGAGAGGVKPLEQLTIKRKDIEEKKGEVIVLQSSI